MSRNERVINDEVLRRIQHDSDPAEARLLKKIRVRSCHSIITKGVNGQMLNAKM